MSVDALALFTENQRILDALPPMTPDEPLATVPPARPRPAVEIVEPPASEPEPMPDDVVDECVDVLPPPDLARHPRILDAFAEEMHAAGVVGEDRLAQVVYLALTSRFLDRPVSVVVKGPSAAGKSFVTEQVLRYMPKSAHYSLSGMSEHALVYLKEPLSHRFLCVYETAGLSGDFASYLVRSLLSEGRCEYVTVVKTKDGMQPKTLVIEGPTGLLVTTTQVGLHPENETRLLSIPACDSAEQTAAVLRALAEEGDGPARDLGQWLDLQQWLEQGEHRVTIPYARELAARVPPVAVRLRRDFATVLNLIRAHAILHRASRERGRIGRIVATIEDYEVVRALIEDLVADEVGATVSATVRETIAAVTELRAEDDKPVTAKRLGESLNLDKSAARRRAKVAIAAGFLTNLEDRRGQPFKLTLGDPLPDERTVLPLPSALTGGTVARHPGGVK